MPLSKSSTSGDRWAQMLFVSLCRANQTSSHTRTGRASEKRIYEYLAPLIHLLTSDNQISLLLSALFSFCFFFHQER